MKNERENFEQIFQKTTPMKNKIAFIIQALFLLGTITIQAQSIMTEDFYAVTVSDCNAEAGICIDISLEDSENYTFTQDGAPYTGGITGCEFDTVFNYSYNSFYGQGNLGPYMLNAWTVNEETFSGQFDDLNGLLALMNNADADGNWQLDPGSLLIYGGDTENTYSTLDITVMSNGLPSNLGYNFGITAQGITLRFATGTHIVTVTDNETSETDEFTVSVLCQPTAETMQVTLQEGATETVCMDFSELQGGNFATIAAGCDSGNTGIIDFNLVEAGTCVEFTAEGAGADSVCFIATDAAGNQDTTYFIVNVLPLTTEPFFFANTIPANQEVYQLCLDMSELQGDPVSLENICPEDSGNFVSFTLDNETNCVKYAGLDCDGTENACIVLCDNVGICDTTFLEITVDNTVCQPQPEYIENTIYQGQFDDFCFEASDLPGTLVSIENVCESIGFVEFTLDENTFCVDYEGLTVGTDNACLVLTDDLGNTDTAYLTVNVITPQVDIVTDVLTIGAEREYCPQTGELPGESYTIFNICEESSGDNVIFNIDDVSLCFNATALSIGTDTACIVVCDENLICDTTFYYITVEEDNVNGVTDIPPTAVDDTFSTSENTPFTANVLGNDIIPPGSQIVVYVLPAMGGGVESTGTAQANNTGTIEYTPTQGYCGEDAFTYVLCNQFGCDTAQVNLVIECVDEENAEIEVMTGFSPNGDGVNDDFRIKGIESYPDNTLKIINRWGNTVYEVVSYRSGWQGDWNGNTLPDGTYFYLLNVKDVGEYRGYVEIKR